MQSQNTSTAHGLNVAPRTRALFVVLAFGLAGFIFTALLMWLIPSADDILNTRHHSIFTRVLDVLAVPALLFFMVVCAYACTELYKIYRLINDPETYRRNRQKTNSLQ
jgi:ABC-type multidrug transport system fused ATPase/permease subunit